MMRRSLVLLIAGAALIAGAVLADIKDPADVDQRIAPPDFQPLGGPYCDMVPQNIPDNDSGAAVSTITVTDTGSIADLNVSVQILHTWIGDLRGLLEHSGGCTVNLWNRIGLETVDGCCGCSGDDMDVTLDDDAADHIEDSCGSGPSGGAAGDFQPGDPINFPTDALFDCIGEDISGDWTLTVTDGAAQDLGTLMGWCLVPGGAPDDGGADDGGDVPATTTWGVIVLIALFLGITLFYLRRRARA